MAILLQASGATAGPSCFIYGCMPTSAATHYITDSVCLDSDDRNDRGMGVYLNTSRPRTLHKAIGNCSASAQQTGGGAAPKGVQLHRPTQGIDLRGQC